MIKKKMNIKEQSQKISEAKARRKLLRMTIKKGRISVKKSPKRLFLNAF